MNTTLCILLFAIFFFSQEVSSLDSMMAPLVSHVMSSPGLNLIPIKNRGDTLQVHLMASVQTVNKVDKEKNQIEAVLFLSTIWKSGVSWDPQDFNGISRQKVFKSQIWTPDIFIVNAASSADFLNPPDVILMSGGYAVMNTHFKVGLDCDVDENKCFIQFQADGFPSSFIGLNGPEHLPFDLSLFQKNWVNTGSRFQARDEEYKNSQHSLFDDNRLPVDIVTYSFSIFDTQPHYGRRPSQLTLAWN